MNNPEVQVPDSMLLALARLSALQREPVDRLALQEAVASTTAGRSPKERLAALAEILQLQPPRWHVKPDASQLPLLQVNASGQWGLLRARDADDHWVSEWLDPQTQQWAERKAPSLDSQSAFASFKLVKPYSAVDSQVLGLVFAELKANKAKLLEGAAGGALLTFLATIISFYSMQVYDRVIPSGATQTLMVLTLGVLISIFLEYAAKRLRAHVYEGLAEQIDQRLARAVYQRFLAIRLDQMPPSVGSLAGQLRGYETVRAFLLALASQFAVDAPFAIAFAFIISAMAGPLALIPLFAFFVAIILGTWHSGRIRHLANDGHQAANRKVGLLVESVEGAEIIKSGQGGWRMLGRWLQTTDEARTIDLETRRLNEAGQYRTMALQQITNVVLIAVGAWMASTGQITMGTLIACTILSGRVLGPVMQLSNQLTQWANVKASLQSLDALWALEDDHHGVTQPVHVDHLRGHYRFENVTMNLRGRPAVQVPRLSIAAGEKIAIIGPVGAGKTTLLRLLSGMYKPSEGRIWLDDVDLSQLSKARLAETMGYLPQDGRLLGGSLRENLILGLLDPGDEAILAAARKTGLYDAVIASQPQGLEFEINEGGVGLSGGQRQLINLTRVFLRKPTIWLLDEPTASLDRAVEQQIVRTLQSTLTDKDTVVIVTHKQELLQLADRILVVAKHQIVMDGARDEVIARLKSGGASPSAPMKVVA